MQKPYKYTIICAKTGAITETNREPLTRDLQTYEPTDDLRIRELKQTKNRVHKYTVQSRAETLGVLEFHAQRTGYAKVSTDI